MILHSVLEIVYHVTDGVESLRRCPHRVCLAELVGQGGDHIDDVQAVRAEIVDNVAVRGDLFRFNFQLVSQIITNTCRRKTSESIR